MEFAAQMMLALLVPASLAVLLRWMQRRGLAATAGRARHMEVIERLSLTAQHSLHLVRVDGKELIVASGPGGCSLLQTAKVSE
jgi:flagellar biogenesis protein FliO